jgi:dTDP-glucose pyrophosphorylase
MAGRGSRFAGSRYDMPKPLIDVAGRPMVAWALDSLQGVNYSTLIFIALWEHERAFDVTARLRQIAGNDAEIVLLDDVTEGQLCTVLTAREWLDSPEDVLIASADTLVISRLGEEIANRPSDVRGIISVADMPGDRWSFARTDVYGSVVEVAEKVRISAHASTGLYYFASGDEFLDAADDLVNQQAKTRGEYYVIPVYQQYITRGRRVTVSIASEMWDMGTPEALSAFTAHYLSQKKG